MISTFPYKLALIWAENESPNGPHDGPGISVSRWSAILDQPWIRFRPREGVPDALGEADAIFINSFHTPDSVHAEAIRARFPNMFIIVSPDPLLDMVLAHPQWMHMHRQMQAANVIAGRTQADAHVYGAFLHKPSVCLPSPIGPSDWYEGYRNRKKEDYIITLDHPFSPENTLANVATLAAIQRETGLRVVYAAARDWTIEYAKMAGLQAEFRGRIGDAEFVELVANAMFGVDMYAANSIGRFGILCAAVGTVSLTSYTASARNGHLHGDINNPYQAADNINELYGSNAHRRLALYQNYQQNGYQYIEENYSFNAARKNLQSLLDNHMKKAQ